MVTEPTTVLFLSRTFPPSTGGMQQFSHHLHAELEEHNDIDLLSKTYGGSKKWLPLVLPYFWMWTLYRLLRSDVDCLYMTDGVLSVIGASLRFLTGVPTVITVHGLDITFDNWVYQRFVVPTLTWHDAVVPVSSATAETARNAGVPAEMITVVPNGVDPDEFYNPSLDQGDLKQQLHEEYDVDLDIANRMVLLSVGRLVERKGCHWFVDAVMPELDDEYVYLICGDGSYRETIQQTIEKNGLDEQVFLLGRVSDDLLQTCYNTADMLLMPNIPVDGDMEGFGLVAVEASSCGTPVIAADMGGMQDAVIDGETGVRVPETDSQAFKSAIEELVATPMGREDVRQETVDSFSWEQRATSYRDVIRTVSS